MTFEKTQSPNLLPVVRELPADLETPISAYLKLAGQGPSFLLESVTGGEQVARYSFIGVGAGRAYVLRGLSMERHTPEGIFTETLPAGTDPLDALRAELVCCRSSGRPQGGQPQGGQPQGGQPQGGQPQGGQPQGGQPQGGQPQGGQPQGLSLPRFNGGLVGYLGYDTVRFFEPTLQLAPHPQLPDAIFLLADTIVAFDHAFGRMLLITNVPPEDSAQAHERLDALEQRLQSPLPAPPARTADVTPTELVSNVTREQFEEAVRAAKEYIAAGDIFQVVLSQRLSRQTSAAPFDIYRALRRLNPSPYMFFFDFGQLAGTPDCYLIGASPEVHVRLEGRRAALRPIAGTRPRGKSPEEDVALERDLLADPKERAEHVMLVDLARNDLGRVCEYGTVHVPEQMVIERYSHVMHIVSHVEGVLKPEYDAFDLMRATFPAGTVSGAPKIRAMEIIAELEGQPRGPYAGAVGYFSYDGSMDTCITIRTLTMVGHEVSVQAGAGIVADSDPAREYQETLNKARALAVAVELAEGVS